MAYCDKCGAYIPDGQTKCLACGYDEAAERAAAAAAAQPAKKKEKRETTFREEELKKELSAQRKKQQEQSRAWAEQEYARRQARREHYSESAGTEESEPLYSGKSEKRSAGGSSYGKVSGEMKNSRFFSILSYFSILFLIPYATRRDDRYTMYHARQGFGLFLFGILCDVVGSATGIGWALSLLRAYLMIKGILNASNGVRAPLPIIGKYAEKLK